jgi:hypothetical protein
VQHARTQTTLALLVRKKVRRRGIMKCHLIHARRYGNADEAAVRKLHGEGERAALPAVFLANIYRTYTWKSEVPPISLIGPMRFRCTRRPPAWL